MTETLLAETTRGGRVESRHAGAFVVCDAAGKIVLGGGSAEAAVFPRSAVKAMQALPLLLGGAAGRFGLGQDALALACASHTGTAAHVRVAEAVLRAAGREAGCLECGAHWPTGAAAARALAAAGALPSGLHNNCSGKHAGFVAVAAALGVDPRGYVAAEHPVMRQAIGAVARVTGARLEEGNAGIDGCSIPTHAIPLRALATGFARMGTGQRLSTEDAEGAAVLREAVARHPVLLAGEGRFDTVVTAAFGAAVFVKGGAEGVHAAALPGLGLGVAIKAWDGAARAAEVAMAALLMRLLRPEGQDRAVLMGLADQGLFNWNGVRVGAVRAALGDG